MAPTDSFVPLAPAPPAAAEHKHSWLRLSAIATSLEAEVQQQLSHLAVLRYALAIDEAKHHELAESLTRFREHRQAATTNLQSVVADES